MELIVDRTESDTLLKNEKGVYSVVDLNRVERAVKEISELFPDLGISLELETKTDWALSDRFSNSEWPVDSQMSRYLNNVETVKRLFGISVWLPSSMANLTWSRANNIERVLQMAMARATATIQSFRYSGEIYSGEV